MTDTTRQLSEQSFFVFVRNTNNGKITRLAIPGDVQIGLQGNPAELQLLGRLSLSTADYTTTSTNKGILFVKNDDTIVSVTMLNTPTAGRITLYLPANPRNGQLHFIKDMSGTAGSVPIDVIPSGTAMIDQFSSKTLSDPFGSLALYWFGDKWRILVSGLGASSGGADAAATYVTLSGNTSLTNERRLNVSGTNLVMTDQGANASVVLDLSSILGAGAGTFTYSTITVDSFGRITAASNGSTPPPNNASYITVTNEPALSSERALLAGTGLTLVDGGPDTNVTLSIKDSVVATVSGTRFSGPVVATTGLSGSLSQLASGISYLVAGSGITISSASNGQITLSSTGVITSSSSSGGADVSASYITVGTTGSLPNERSLAAGVGLSLTDGGPGGSITINLIASGSNFSSGADVSASYVTIGNTGSLPNERALAAGAGLALADGGPNSNVTLSINNSVVATLSGSTFSGPVVAGSGLSGSLSQLSSGISYLVAGRGINITTSSNGQVTINNTISSSVAVNQQWVDGGNTLSTTSSVAIDGLGRTAGSIGTDVFLFVSGTINVATGSGNPGRIAVFGGDVKVSGTLTVGSGAMVLTSNDIQLGSFGTRIEKNGSNLKFFDANNPSGRTLSSLGGGSSNITPIFNMSILAGTVVTNTAVTGSKQSLGAVFFNPTIINAFSGTKNYFYRAIVDTSETPVSAAMDLYDIGGIVTFPPGIVQNSTMSSSNIAMTQVQINLTTVLQGVTGSGIFEARLWKTLSGSTTSSVTCRNARLEVEYT